jgi:hypothetical protein
MRIITLVVGIAALALIGCGQQTSGPKEDQKSSVTADNNYVDKSTEWKSGDKASWEKAIRLRSEGQNDYVRSKSL